MKIRFRAVSFLLAVILVIGLMPIALVSAASTVNVMSYNLKNTNYSFGSVSSMITNAGAELIGMQEVTLLQYPLLSTAMSSAGYSAIKGNNRGDGEYAPIFYKTSKFTLLRSGCYWLSDTPTEESKFEESSYYRICTWGYFQIKNTNDYLIMFNTHLDFGLATVIKQMDVILKDIIVKTNELTNARNHVIITGDFNTASSSAASKYLLGDSAYNGSVNTHTKQRLDESRQIASKVVLSSFGNYYTQPASGPTSDLDHIFVTHEGFQCTYYQVLSDAAGSDHLPIIAKLTYKTATHNYDYQYKSNGTHSVTCAHCSYSATQACTMSEEHCSLCGGGGTEKFRLVTDQNDLTTGRYVMVIAATGTYTGSSAYYSVGLKQDSGFNSLVSYGLGFTQLPETITLQNADVAKMVWNLEGSSGGFTLKNVSDKALYYNGKNDLLFGRHSATTWNGVMSTTTFHWMVKYNTTGYLALRTDLNTLGKTDVNSPLVSCVPNTSTGNFRVFFFKKYEECLHPDTSTATTPATCTEDGTAVTTCNACGEVLSSETLAATGHSYGSVVTAPTCNAQGFTTYTCSVCNDNYVGNYTAQLSHSYKATTVAATCTSAGYTTYQCTLCGYSYVGNEVSATGHNYVAKSTAPSCTQIGITTYTCTACGDSYEGEQTAATGHSYKSTRTEPTCTISGKITYTCTACGSSYFETIPALGHSYATVVTAPTCTQAGKTTFTCSTCGYSYVGNYVSATGHRYLVTTVEATCTTAGATVYTCELCANSYSQTIPQLSHHYTQVVTPATCTQNGVTTYTCDSCGHSYTGNQTAAIGHAYTQETIAPTCTQAGMTVYTCSICQDSYNGDEISAIGHSYTSKTTPPTCEESGKTTYTCSSCGDFYTGEEIAPNGHQYSAQITESTCVQKGLVTYTCEVCADSYTQELAMSAHTTVFVPEVDAVCGKAGNVEHYRCTVCEKYFADAQTEFELPENYVILPALSHQCVYHPYVDSTCTQAGNNAYYYCSNCDGYFFDANAQYVAPLSFLMLAPTGHSYAYRNNGENHVITCAKCTYSEVKQHNYAEGICLCGAEESAEPSYVPNANLTLTMSISVGAEMQVIYNVLNSKVKSFDTFYVEVVKEVADAESITTIFSVENGNMTAVTNAAGNISRYMATYTGIFAVEMGDNFTATVYAVGADGTIYYGPSVSSSVKTFLMQQLADDSAPAELKTLAVDMLNYGAAAQVNFNYDIAHLANADLTETQKAFGTRTIPTAVDASAMSATGGRVVTSVSVQSRVMLYLTFIYKASAASDLKVVIKAADGTILSEYAPTEINTNNCKAVYDDVGAGQMRDLLTIELYDNGTLVSKTLTWSVESYVAQIREDSASTEALINAVNAMLAYGDSAEVYLRYTGQ